MEIAAIQGQGATGTRSEGTPPAVGGTGALTKPADAAVEKARMGEETKFNPQDVEDAVAALDQTVRAFSERISFVLHRESGRMQVQVIDNATQEIVKEIPPTAVLEVIARIREMVGLLLDEKV
ncbi:flagellar protein FlaG [Gelria sp. Kuro-4]|uniref:flagellar protein FlaG n=1 Tax=Gelria sp. Kuro-4 TaxID=2796927 RepID=UPI001BEDEA62|nr:flagellar protein FlaG [Gelria sp. Kuro-4]BCV25492.1 flagellar protein FlaG [Gelria sp. Kuro-4]